jgi:hypothetical protein
MYETAAQIMAAFLIGYVVDMRLDPRNESAIHPLAYGATSTIGILVCLGPGQNWLLSALTDDAQAWHTENGWLLSLFVYAVVTILAVLLLLRISGILPPGADGNRMNRNNPPMLRGSSAARSEGQACTVY